MAKCNRYQETGIIEDDYDIVDDDTSNAKNGDTWNINWLILVILILVACIVLLIVTLVCCMVNQYHCNCCKSMYN